MLIFLLFPVGWSPCCSNQSEVTSEILLSCSCAGLLIWLSSFSSYLTLSFLDESRYCSLDRSTCCDNHTRQQTRPCMCAKTNKAFLHKTLGTTRKDQSLCSLEPCADNNSPCYLDCNKEQWRCMLCMRLSSETSVDTESQTPNTRCCPRMLQCDRSRRLAFYEKDHRPDIASVSGRSPLMAQDADNGCHTLETLTIDNL